MTQANRKNEEAIVRSAGGGITKRSALARRGLSSLTDTVWTSKRLSEGASWSGCISPFGLVADSDSKMVVDNENAHVWCQTTDIVDFAFPSLKFSIESLGEYSYIQGKGMPFIPRNFLKNMVETNTYSTEGKVWAYAESAVSFAWSPCGNYLVTGAGNSECTLRFFDIRQRLLFDSFRAHGDSLYSLDWSSNGQYVVSASPIRDPRLIVWKCDWVDDLFGRRLESIEKCREMTSLEPYPEHYHDPARNDWYGFYGFNKCSFSPDCKQLIANASIRNGSDFFVVFELPSVSEVNRVDLGIGTEEVLSLSWTRDSKNVF